MPFAGDTPRATFHHGDLPAQALAWVRERVAAQGPDSFTLRELAAALGVNHRALYRHFPDRQAVLAALAAGELGLLVDAMEVALAAEEAPQHRHTLMTVYVGYALEQPQLYELVFSRPLRHGVAADDAMGVAVRRLMRLAAQTFADPGDGPAATRDRVVRAWGLAHGLLLLMRRGALRMGSAQQAERYIVASVFGGGPACGPSSRSAGTSARSSSP